MKTFCLNLEDKKHSEVENALTLDNAFTTMGKWLQFHVREKGFFFFFGFNVREKLFIVFLHTISGKKIQCYTHHV